MDLTGAGDLFAAGFLFGLARNKTLEECGRYGSLASSEIMKTILEDESDLYQNIQANLKIKKY